MKKVIVSIPDNATNGDMLAAVFPREVKDVDVDWFGEEWWNSPYKTDEVKENAET